MSTASDCIGLHRTASDCIGLQKDVCGYYESVIVNICVKVAANEECPDQIPVNKECL